MRSSICFLSALLLTSQLFAQDTDPGKVVFETRCSRCHGSDGNGGEMGPAIGGRLAAHNDQQLAALIREGLPAQGMPAIQVSETEMGPLTRFLRTLQPRMGRERPVVRQKVTITDGKILDGYVLNQGFDDLPLRTDDKRIHLLRRIGDRYREVTSSSDWPGYNGDPGGNRYTRLSQITKANVAKLTPKWMFSLPNTAHLQVTPVVVGGLMYVSAANECYALDAGSGREVWHYRRPLTRGTAAAGHTRARAVYMPPAANPRSSTAPGISLDT
jgi:alcohol dehydrogenase (cytochrome c)